MSLPNHFDLVAPDGQARTGRLTTPHGVVRPPAFMPVGTAGAMKGMHWREVRDAGADIVLGNTYHLMLRPGAERIAALGGLQTFTGWNGPMLTDSGGFQVMSMSELRKVAERAVTFRSHIDGAMVKAIARAFRWREMLENGEYATIREIANAEKINESYVGRVLRMTLLAPEVVEAILGGRQSAHLQLETLMKRFPVDWTEQRSLRFLASGS